MWLSPVTVRQEYKCNLANWDLVSRTNPCSLSSGSSISISISISSHLQLSFPPPQHHQSTARWHLEPALIHSCWIDYSLTPVLLLSSQLQQPFMNWLPSTIQNMHWLPSTEYAAPLHAILVTFFIQVPDLWLTPLEPGLAPIIQAFCQILTLNHWF